MVSFRNSQLRAIVVGLVIADALSQGQLSWPSGQFPMPTSGWMRQSAGAIADDRWSQMLSHQFQRSKDYGPSLATETSSLPTVPVAVAATPALPALLTQLPWLLRQLDSPLPTADAATLALHGCLNAGLRRDEQALGRLQQHCETSTELMSSAIGAGICQAITLVLAVQGDFQLAIGQSLYESPAIVGLPVLTGILSAGWGDLSSVPCCYRHQLNQPDPSLKGWLQWRWQITDGVTLSTWATNIWRGWLGMDRRALQRLSVTVMPTAAGSPLES